MKKKILIGLIAVFLLAVFYLIYISRLNKNKVAVLTPPAPDIQSSLIGKLPVKLSVKKDEFKFPKALPILSFSKRNISKANAQNLAQNLKIQGQIEEFEDISEGVKYYASDDSYFLVITPKSSIIKYGVSSGLLPAVPRKILSEEDLKNLALSFFLNNGFYGENQVKPMGVRYLKRSSLNEGLEKAELSSAEVVQVDFSFSSEDYQVFSQYSVNPLIFVQLLPNGEIYYSEAVFSSSVQKGFSDYPLKTFEDIASSLSEAKLINLSGDYISISDLSIKDIQELDIQTIRLAYLLEDGKEDSLQPIFILEGPAKISGSSANKAILYMPAFK